MLTNTHPKKLVCLNTVYCDTTTTTPSPYIPPSLQQCIFNHFYTFSHPSKRATLKLISERFVWPQMNKDIRFWTGNCTNYQWLSTDTSNHPHGYLVILMLIFHTYIWHCWTYINLSKFYIYTNNHWLIFLLANSNFSERYFSWHHHKNNTQILDRHIWCTCYHHNWQRYTILVKPSENSTFYRVPRTYGQKHAIYA